FLCLDKTASKKNVSRVGSIRSRIGSQKFSEFGNADFRNSLPVSDHCVIEQICARRRQAQDSRSQDSEEEPHLRVQERVVNSCLCNFHRPSQFVRVFPARRSVPLHFLPRVQDLSPSPPI